MVERQGRREGVRKGWDSSASDDILVCKLGPDGAIEWQKAFDGGFSDWGDDIVPTADGGYLVLGSMGQSFQGTKGAMDTVALKLDGNGNVQ